MTRSRWLTVVGVALSVGVLLSLLGGPATDQFETRFTPVASYRNPNNTGPVQRIYLVTVSQVDHAEMRAYGDLQPHSKYGTTTVYFFPEDTPLPSRIGPQGVSHSTDLLGRCLARYRKLGQGQERYQRGPLPSSSAPEATSMGRVSRISVHL